MNIHYLMRAELQFRNTTAFAMPFQEIVDLFPFESEKDIKHELHTLPVSEPAMYGLAAWYHRKQGTSWLETEFRSAGNAYVRNGRLMASVPEGAALLKSSGVTYPHEIDISWMVTIDDIAYPAPYLLKQNRTSLLHSAMFDMEEQVWISVFAADSGQDDLRLFPYSDSGIQQALDYALSILNDDNIFAEINLSSMIPYQVSSLKNFARWFLVRPNEFRWYSAPDRMKNIGKAWAEQHHLQCSDGYPFTANRLERKHLEETITELQRLLSDHMQEIRSFALSRPYNEDDRFHVLFRDRKYGILADFDTHQEMNAIPLDWGDIPPGAVYNAYLMLNRLNALKKDPVFLTCVRFNQDETSVISR